MFGKISMSKMLAVVMIASLMSTVSVQAVRVDTLKKGLKVYVKLMALSVTGSGTVVGTLTVANVSPIATIIDTGITIINGGGMTPKFRACVAIPTALCAVATYKLGKNLVDSYKDYKKASKASTVVESAQNVAIAGSSNVKRI